MTNHLKLTLNKALRFYLLAILSLTAIAAPTEAHAQLIVSDPIQTVIDNFVKTMDQLQASFNHAGDMLAQAIQLKAASGIADTTAINTRSNEDVRSAQDINNANMLPSTYSACAIAKAARAGGAAADGVGSFAAAAAQGGSPLETPVTAAKNIKNGLDLGLDPCSNSNDTEYSANKSLNCTAKYGGIYERTDRVLAAMYAVTNVFVPANFKGAVNGVYQPLDTSLVSTQKYMPFAVLYSMCQHLAPHLPPAPQAVPGNPTTAVLAKDAYKDAETQASAAMSECMFQLGERSAYSSQAQGAYLELHKDQATACTADVTNGILSADPVYTYPSGGGTCQNDGRSTIERLKNITERDQSQSYHAVYLAGADRHDILAENRALPAERQAYSAYIAHERAALAAAILASNDAAKIYTSALSTPVQQ